MDSKHCLDGLSHFRLESHYAERPSDGLPEGFSVWGLEHPGYATDWEGAVLGPEGQPVLVWDHADGYASYGAPISDMFPGGPRAEHFGLCADGCVNRFLNAEVAVNLVKAALAEDPMLLEKIPLPAKKGEEAEFYICEEDWDDGGEALEARLVELNMPYEVGHANCADGARILYVPAEHKDFIEGIVDAIRD